MILLHLLIYLLVARLSAFDGCGTILMTWQGEMPFCVSSDAANDLEVMASDLFYTAIVWLRSICLFHSF